LEEEQEITEDPEDVQPISVRKAPISVINPESLSDQPNNK